MLKLKPFQRKFLRSALAQGIRTSALSLPRGNGKSTLVAWLGSRALTPGDPAVQDLSHLVLGPRAIAREADREVRAPGRAGLPAPWSPDAAAREAGSEVPVSPDAAAREAGSEVPVSPVAIRAFFFHRRSSSRGGYSGEVFHRDDAARNCWYFLFLATCYVRRVFMRRNRP